MIPTLRLRLEVGPVEDPTDLLESAGAITIRRGLDLDGVTDQPSPASANIVVEGSALTNPVTNADLRPERPLRFLAGIEDAYGTSVTWATIWTGTILRANIEHEAEAKHDPDAYQVFITATDIVPALAATPSEVAVSGNLAQRVDAVMAGTGLPYDVTDPAPVESSGPLPTDAKTVLGQLRLIRDTLHAALFVDRTGTLRMVGDGARERAVTTPDLEATDEDPAPAGAVLYHDIAMVFDTDSVVNVLAVTKLADPDPIEGTFTDEDSRNDWGTHPQEVTVNDGLIETHAGLFLATRVDPDLVPARIAFLVDPIEDTYSTHLAAACAIEIGDTIDVTRLDRTHRLTVRELTHTVALVLDPLPRLRWTVEVGLRVPDVLATRWDDVPADLTWDDVPPDLTWDDAVNWHPYLEGA